MKINFQFNRADLVLITALAILNLFLLFHNPMNEAGNYAVIQVNQKEFARAALSNNQIIKVPGPLGITEVQIEDGRARIIKSPCQNKICIKSGYIQYADRISACIPNRVLVRIVGVSRETVDTIVG
ncbi:MAG: hypothetical protein COV66_10495 [Nitrospinae bacterium CG11_big_fil_rev_8_21_14_0_20_45_15]|nr:MAG: hypothetical protein COV66_10495 [Nitrospinae bacterium CG11_big_fil_rev_8_21_14_0_20_45_15]